MKRATALAQNPSVPVSFHTGLTGGSWVTLRMHVENCASSELEKFVHYYFTHSNVQSLSSFTPAHLLCIITKWYIAQCINQNTTQMISKRDGDWQ